MRSLFEKEKNKNSINQLKIGLISRFYPLTKFEIFQYKSILNFDRYHLMSNDSVKWDNDLLEKVIEKIDWSALWKIKNIKFDFAFFKKFESEIDFHSIQLSENIEWSKDLLSEFGDKFDWSKSLIIKEPVSTIENLRRYNDFLDWGLVSQRINIEFTDELLQEFSEKWDWKKLSANKNIPLSIKFIQKYMERLDFDALSQNPKSLPIIYKYPTSKKWKWDKVILNSAIRYNKDSFDFIFSNYKKEYEAREFAHPILKKMALPLFLFRVFSARKHSDVHYFLQDDFINYLPWEKLCKFVNSKLTLEFIDKYKDKLNFQEPEFIKNHRDIISKEFVECNIHLFNPENRSFYYLPLTIEILDKFSDKIDWYILSSNEKLNWNWEYIEANYDKFNFFRLSENRGIYDKLIIDKLSKLEVIEFLDKELAKQR